MSTTTIPGLTIDPTPALADLIETSKNPGSFNISLGQLSDFYQLLSLKNAANGYAGLDASSLLNVGQIPTAIPAINIADGTVDNTEFQFLNGVTSLIQTQLDATEKTANKGAVSGYAGLDASQELLLANFPSGTGLQVLRRNTGNTALEFFTLTDLQGITSINADTTAAQLIVGTTNVITVGTAAGTTTIDIDSAYVGQASITTLGTITTGVWNGTDITLANIANGTANQIIKTNAGGTALEFGFIGDDNTDTFTTTKITTTSKSLLNSAIVYTDQANVFGDFTQTFKDNRIIIESPNGLTPTTLVNAQQTLARNLTIPILTGNRSIVVTTEASQITIGTEVTGASTNLTDTADIAYLNTTNAYNAGTRQDFLGLLAGTAGLNVGAIAGNPTTQVNGDIWLNSSTNQIFGRINGVDIDLGAAGAGAPPFADTTSIVEGSTDPTKEMRFEVDGLTTATTRVVTIPDVDVTLVSTTDGLITNANVAAAAAIATTKLADSANFVLSNQTNTFGDFAQIFPDNQLFIQNPAATFTYQISAAGIAANRTITLPLLTGNDVFVTEAFNQTLSNKTFTTPTIASFTNATHDHVDAAGGGTLLSTSALSDTADIAYLNTDNTFLTNTRQTFTHQASKAGIALAAVTGDVTTPNNGEFWYNSTSNKFRARENGATVDMIGGGGTVLWTVLDNQVAGGSVTEFDMTFTAVDFDDDSKLVLVMDAEIDGAMNVKLEINGVTTGTHFSDGRRIGSGGETLIEVNSSPSMQVISSGSLVGNNNVFFLNVDIGLTSTAATRPFIMSQAAISTQNNENMTGLFGNTTANISAVRIFADANNFKIGSRVTLYKVARA